jgi:hypothetical protein
MSENMLTIPADNATVKAVVNQVKSDLRGGSKYAAYVAEFKVTRETVKDHALAIARLVTPETPQTTTDENGVKSRTRFGNAVQAAGNGLRSALPKDEAKPTDWIKLVRQAVDNAHNKGEFTADRILSEVREVLRGENPDLTVAA